MVVELGDAGRDGYAWNGCKREEGRGKSVTQIAQISQNYAIPSSLDSIIARICSINVGMIFFDDGTHINAFVEDMLKIWYI